MRSLLAIVLLPLAACDALTLTIDVPTKYGYDGDLADTGAPADTDTDSDTDADTDPGETDTGEAPLIAESYPCGGEGQTSTYLHDFATLAADVDLAEARDATCVFYSIDYLDGYEAVTGTRPPDYLCGASLATNASTGHLAAYCIWIPASAGLGFEGFYERHEFRSR